MTSLEVINVHVDGILGCREDHKITFKGVEIAAGGFHTCTNMYIFSLINFCLKVCSVQIITCKFSGLIPTNEGH